MSRARIYLKNLTANWVGYGANLAIMFFMSPFVVHSLGDVNFGVWSLMMSLTGYLGLIELGARSGIGRFINYYLGKDDVHSVNDIITTGFVILLFIGVVLGVASGTIALTLQWIFPKIPLNLLSTSRIVVLLVAANLWLAFISAPFKQVLQAYERFELVNGIDLLVLLARTGGTIFVLETGHGLVALAEVQLAGSLLGLILAYWMARKVFPKLAIHRSLASWSRFRELFGFSLWSFVGSVAWQLLYSADTLVIMILLGPEWATCYGIGGILLFRGRELISQAISVFYPKMLQDCARKDWSALQGSFGRGSNLSMGIGILVLIGMIAFGREFIVLWMGPQYERSYTILAILATSSLPAVAVSISSPIYEGLNRVRLSSILTLLQGLANLGLTLLFVLSLDMGIDGVAWGTFYPRIFFAILCGVIAMRWIHIPVFSFFARVVSRWSLLAVAFFAACWLINSLGEQGHWAYFFAKVLAACVVYLPLSWVILLEKRDRALFATMLNNNLFCRVRKVPQNVSTNIEEF